MAENMNLDLIKAIRNNIETVIVGKKQSVELLIICLICGGHALIEDVPGLGKTTMVSTLANSVDLPFQRIQFTPDVLPSDITGFTMYHAASGEKEFYPGAVFSNIILADEINRTSPKTQSALLQAMQEKQVTIDGITHELSEPFMVCATQNPVELTGTYPLPEAQLDRFLVKISMGYPSQSEEISIMEKNREDGSVSKVKAVANKKDIIKLREAVENVKCARGVLSYIAELADFTRNHEDVSLGVSPRASIALMRASMGLALMEGRDYVLPDDVQKMVKPVLSHRLILNPHAYINNQTADSVLEKALQITPVPGISE
ncbi:MAG: MoxR family ATPase [Oscillospiraceae bacterium]|nr:MoxR family ATPase [Oscillospiraceae bacterium]